MKIEERIYGKSELALVYFPSCDPATALRRLTRWIKRNTSENRNFEKKINFIVTLNDIK